MGGWHRCRTWKDQGAKVLKLTRVTLGRVSYDNGYDASSQNYCVLTTTPFRCNFSLDLIFPQKFASLLVHDVSLTYLN